MLLGLYNDLCLDGLIFRNIWRLTEQICQISMAAMFGYCFVEFDKRPPTGREVVLNECAGRRPERATPAYFRPTVEIIAFTLI
jgi:hypothetical protein